MPNETKSVVRRRKDSRSVWLTALVVLLGCAQLTWSGPVRAADECEYAIVAYRQASEELTSALRHYARCLESADPMEDCREEFRRLESAQTDREDAADQYIMYCRQ